jgi:tetrahydromethanopterin S-methyltransferase subunit B
MAEKQYFAHQSPGGHDSWYWLGLVGYDFDYAGENLALDFTESDKVEEAWMNSPLHRDNIVNTNYREIGIATVDGTYQGRPTTYVVQFFGTPKTIAPVVDTFSELKTERVITTPIVTASNPVVLGVEIKNNIEKLNTMPNVARMQVISETAAARTPWTTWLRELLARSSKIAMAFYGTLAGLILLTLFGMFLVHFRHHHHRHYAHGLLLVLILISCMYMSSTFITGIVLVG